MNKEKLNQYIASQEAAASQEPEEKSISFGDFVSALGADSIARSAQNLETAQMEAPIGETIIDTASGVAEGIAGLPDAWSRIMAAENGITASFTDENIREANESGDYSTLDTAAETLREEGGAAGNALLEPAYALTRPTRERLGSAVNTWADEGSDLAANIRNTATYVDYMMSDEAKLQKAREIEADTGISAEAILNDSDAYKQALKIDDFTRKQKELMSGDFSMEAVFDEYPELKDIAKMSPSDAALALHNIESVRSTHSVIESFTHFLEAGNKKLEYDNLQYKIMMGTADENDRLRAANLQKEIEKEQKEAPSFWDDPAAAMAAALAQSTPEMWQSITEGARDASILASAAMIAGAAAGSAVPVLGTGVGAAAGGFAGFVAGFGRSMLTQASRRQAVKAAVGAGLRVGMVQGMAKPESGSRFAEYKELKDENGNPLLTDEEARGWALLGGYANAGIEMANFGAVTKALGGVPHAGKIFSDIIGRAGAELTAKEAIKNIARDRVVDTLKITGSESGEEMLQSVSDDLIHNSMLASKNVSNGQYSAGEILTRGAASFVESLPGSLAFGLIGAGGGTFTSGLKARAALKHKASVDAKFGADAKKTINGTLMLEQLQQAVADGKMKETAPDVQQKILRNQLTGTGFETAYIDVEMALKNKNGREDLKKVADAAGISEDKLNVAIEEGGFLSVPVEQYSQSAASPELLQSVSFDADADSIARMKESARVTTEAVQKAQEAAIDRQLRLMDNIVNEYYPEGQADKDVRDAVLSSIYTNPQNPKLGWQNLNASIRQELDDILAPAMAALKAGMGQGVDILNFEDDLGNKSKYVKASNNAPWYSNFYKLHHRAPNAAELEEMAVDLTIGAPTAPKVEGWIPDSEEAVASMKETEEQIRSLQAQLKTMGKIKDQMGKMTGAEMQLTEGLSKEAFHIYRELTELLMTAKGTSARAARMGAILYARHADIYAEAATRATGSKYTAADYARGVRVQIGKDGKPQEVTRAAAQVGSTLNELLPSVDIDEEVDVLNLDKITDELKGKSLADVKAYIQNLSETKPIPTADFLAMVGMPERADSLGRTHIVRGTSQRGSNITVRNKTLLNLETIIRNSRVIEITANTKQKPFTGLNGRKRKAQGRKNKVKRYFRIMTPVQFNNRPATLAITAEDFGSGVTLDRENVSLYEIKLHKKRDPLPAPPLGTRMSESPSALTVPEKNELVKVTIREMLTGIPDAEGKPFINEDGTANVFSFKQMAGEASLTADRAALAEAQRMAEGGASEQEIYDKTGWLKGKDGKWRYEIPDNLDDIDFSKLEENGEQLLGNIYRNDKLYDAYPDLRFQMVRLDELPRGTSGRYTWNGSESIVLLDKTHLKNEPQEAKSTLVHELQHIIQDKEGFAVGGRPDRHSFYMAHRQARAIFERLPKDLFEKLSKAESRKEDKNLSEEERSTAKAEYNALKKAHPAEVIEYETANYLHGLDQYDAYRNLAGEQEARAAESRAGEYTKATRENKRVAAALDEALKKASPESREAYRKYQELSFKQRQGEELSPEEDATLDRAYDDMGEDLQEAADDFSFDYTYNLPKGLGVPKPHRWNAIVTFDGKSVAVYGLAEEASFNQETAESNLANWFGESKIVNEDGTPKIVYHGTATDVLEIFDKKKAQDKTGRRLGLGWGKGKFYFTEYEVGALGAAMGAQGRGQRGKPRTIPVYLKVEKPITLTEYERRYKELSGGHDLSGEGYTDSYTSKERDKLIARLDKAVRKEGYDGIVDRDSGAIAVFDNKQIKAVGNYGEFNPSDPNIYHQGPQGTTQLYSDGSRVISLFETADESTFVHELGHLFLMDLANLAQIDKTSAKELEIVNGWATWHEGAAKEYSNTPWAREFKAREREILAAEREGRLDDAARLKEVWRQERFARAFELYLRDGHAPAKGLKAVFRKFKSFLRQIYAAFSGDGGKASMEVRRVMDRLIATEDEIEEASLDDRFSDVTKAGGEKLFNETEEETYKRWLTESEEEAKEKLTAILMKDLTEKARREYNERIAREKARIRQELENENCYLAEAAVKATGDKNIVTEFGFESVEDYEAFMAGAGPLEENLQILIEEYENNLDQELINARVTDEQINEAMQTPEARAKLDELTSAALAKKRGLANRITSKTERAIQDVEDKITALPEDVDLKMNRDSAPVKRLMKALGRLDVAARWKSEDFARIQKMVEAATKEELAEALKDFKAKAREDKANEAAVEKANQGRLKLYREQAAAMIQRKTIGEISPYTFEREARTAARRVKTAIRAKNWDLAISMQQQQALMQAMYHEAIKARQEVDRLINKVKDQMNRKSVRLPKEERYWHRHLAYLLRISKRDVEKPEGELPDLNQMFKDAADAHETEEAPKIITDISAQGENFGGYQTLTMDELREAVDALTMLYTTGKDRFNLKSIGGRSIADVVGEIMGEAGAEAQNMLTTRHTVEKDEGGLFYSDLLAKLPGTLGGESIGRIIAKKGQEYVAGIIKPEEILRALGPTAHRYIYGLYERAADKEGKMLADATEGLRQILSTYTDKEKREWKKRKYKLKLNGTKIFASEEILSKENIICMALNMGNATNWQRLVGGFEQMPTKEHPDKAAALRGFIEENMDKRDWELVQAVWDYIDTYWKDTMKVEETLTGVALKKVQADAFTVKMPDGEEINMRGGYYPIAYAPDKSAKAAEQEENREAQGMMSGAMVLGSQRSHVKERSSENVINRPLRLEFSVIPDHVQQVVHNICYRVAARDVYRLINNRDFEEHVSATLGTEYHRILKEWATDTWSIMDPGANRAQGMLNRVFSSLRRNSVMAIMGYRLWPAVENLSNLAVVMDKFGATKAISAMTDFYSHMEGSKEFLYKSTFMRNRLNNLDRDIRSQTGLFEADIKPIAFMKEHAYDLMLYSDLMISAPTWVQAYKDAYLPKLREVREENEANIKKIQETQEALDKAKAQITDLQKNSTDIENYLTARSYGTPEEVEAYRDSPFLKRSFGDLQAESAEHRRAAGEVKKGLWKLEEEHNKALQLPLYTDTEILDEAETRAVEAADAVIRDTFGSGRTQDLASIQRARGELYKFMTTFSSFFNTQFNAILAKYRQAKYGGMESTGSTGGWSHFEKWWPFYRAVTYRLVMTSLIGSALKFALGLDGDDDKKRKYIDPETGEEKEEDVSSLERFLKVFGKNVLSMTTGALIGVRELATVAINYLFDGTSYSGGVNPVSVGYRSLGELGTTIDLIARKSEKDLEIEAQEAKRRKKQQDALKKKHGKARQEYLKKIEEDEKYRKPPKRITYSEIARHGLGGMASLTAANTGVTSTVVDAVTGTMQYLNDTDNRYDADWRNIVWSALFDKKPVEREIPDRPPKEETGKKKKKKTASE